MTSAFAVYNTSYELRTPYISVEEYQNAPTAMDTLNLIAGGGAEANETALRETIGRASSWIDSHTCGFAGTLSSTAETENARIWGSYRNTMLIKTKFWPITEVRAFTYSAFPGGLANNQGLPVTPSTGITIYPQEFEVATSGGAVGFDGQGALGFGGFGTSGFVKGVQYDTEYTYVAGWVNTLLASSVAAGSTSIIPASTTGIYPGTTLGIYDLPFDEQGLVVAAGYVPGASVVPLVTALQYSHPFNPSATVSNMPPAIKQAAILATTAMIKQRGSGALVASDIGDLTRTQSGASQGSGGDWDDAKCLLMPYRQNYISW